MKYSIVIPTYNNRVMLNNTLEALNDQEGFESGGYEVIVVDDGSSEDTLSYIEGTPRTYSFRYLYLERTADSCRSRVRNAGWRQAAGEIVIFLDSDMIVFPNYMKELDHYFSAEQDIFVFSFRYMLKDPVSIDDVRSRRIFQKNYHSIEYFEGRHFDALHTSYNNTALEHPWMPVYSCSMALPKRRLEEIGGFDERYKGWGVEDWDVAYRCMMRGMKILSHLGMTALHQYHGEVFGDLRTMERMIDWDRNIGLMYRLNPTLEKQLPRMRMNIAYFTRTTTALMMRKERNRSKHELVLKSPEEIPFLQAELKRLSAEPGRLIIVRDEIGSTALHLWIQLLGYTESEIQYFPRAFELDLESEEIKQYFSGIFTWKRQLTLTYRSVRLLWSKMFSTGRHVDAAR